MNNTKRSSCVLFLSVIIFFSLISCSSSDHKRGNSYAEKQQQTICKAKDTVNQKADTFKIKETITAFITAIKIHDGAAFKHLIADQGLVVIRNFVTGTYGARGKNVRSCYMKIEIPADMLFPVAGEIPVSPIELFQNTIDSGLSKIKYSKIQGLSFAIKDKCPGENIGPTTNNIIANLDSIFTITGIAYGNPSVVILSSKEAILIDGEDNNGLPTGGFAIFENQGSEYVLRAVFDFR